MTERTDRDAPRTAQEASSSPQRSDARGAGWQRPHFTVIPLDCEISAYAPDGEDPLF